MASSSAAGISGSKPRTPAPITTKTTTTTTTTWSEFPPTESQSDLAECPRFSSSSSSSCCAYARPSFSSTSRLERKVKNVAPKLHNGTHHSERNGNAEHTLSGAAGMAILEVALGLGTSVVDDRWLGYREATAKARKTSHHEPAKQQRPGGTIEDLGSGSGSERRCQSLDIPRKPARATLDKI
ncbi:hypothetical protein AND_007505 [Anopheles darlingi]|uniref:Uncharacterized protein n=1 Tax=Anopheles darlingi TaxID=43151 RepID=W5J8T3_ANODA|nr:hypothetical protein AND_007505 [Anopheles darlingi]